MLRLINHLEQPLPKGLDRMMVSEAIQRLFAAVRLTLASSADIKSPCSLSNLGISDNRFTADALLELVYIQ